jgi:hypothetical protein
MSSAKRKIKRRRKKEAQKDLEEKIGLFNKMPNECTMCDRPFDKKNKEQVNSWRVAVREREEKVNLYCPKCWDYANDILKKVMDVEEVDTNVR